MKLILGIVIGLIVGGGGVMAARVNVGLQDANDIYQFNCDSLARDSGCNRVAVFDDQDNKCYISFDHDGRQSSISCVKR